MPVSTWDRMHSKRSCEPIQLKQEEHGTRDIPGEEQEAQECGRWRRLDGDGLCAVRQARLREKECLGQVHRCVHQAGCQESMGLTALFAATCAGGRMADA